MAPQKRLLRHWRRIIAASVVAAVGGLVIIGLVIGRQVGAAVARAQRKHPGGGVPALMAVAGSREAPLEERNRAVWALGQLGASTALPLLESLATGAPCADDSVVCQRELNKAIALCRGDFNVGALVWRHGELAPDR